MKIKKFTLVEGAMYVVIKGSENLCKTQVLCAAATQPLTLTLSPKGREDKKKISSPIGEGAICHPELISGSHKMLNHIGQSYVHEMLKHGGQSDVQHDITNYPLPQSLPRVKEAEELSSRFTLNPSLKRTYSHINLFTYSPYKKTAFTLAEVLITLGIIGVVAAMTIPTVVAKYQHKVLETQFKKAYSILYQLVLQVQNDTGMPLNVKDYSHAYTGDNYKLYNTLKPYIMANFCTTKGCIDRIEVDDGTGQNMKEYKTYNNKVNTSSYYMEGGGFILPDSMSIYIENYNEKNLMLSVDVNGVQKRPNRWGHDLFIFSIDNKTGKLIPNGVDGAYHGSVNRDTYCSLTSTSKDNGLTCSYYALTDPNYFKNLP